MEFMEIKKEGPVGIMVWKHEEQNRFTTPFLIEINEALSELLADDSVSSVVIASGLEKYFSTGLHLEWMMAQGASDPNALKEFLLLIHKNLVLFTSYPKPLVAAITGHIVAAGCIFGACMDYRYMSEDRGFIRLPEVQINIPFWPGMRAIFQSILPPRAQRDLFYTGDRFTAKQAMEMGYVDALFPAEEVLSKTLELAEKLGRAKTETYAHIKRDLRRHVLRIMKEEDPKAIEFFLSQMAQNR
jgi:enoyl-CoA hydratase/carnithine racemase